MIWGMRFLPKLVWSSANAEDSEAAPDRHLPTDSAADVPAADVPVESHLLMTLGWISAALGAVALGVVVGREIRLRYKFNRQTPYDLYSHSGDELPDVDWGVGI
jgi:hypothetical protein